MSETKWERRLSKLQEAGYTDSLNEHELIEFGIVCSYFEDHYFNQFGLYPAAEDPGLRLEQRADRKHIVVELIHLPESTLPVFDIYFYNFNEDIQKHLECESVFDAIAFIHQLK
jgi:hypothetical protein